ncbi:MAG: hypothetical protein MUE60_05045, partial [Candidatus Eisenbacteria bacterium]|nr:hypothetical protein [Candidatus Eisenbacteria bacterium]
MDGDGYGYGYEYEYEYEYEEGDAYGDGEGVPIAERGARNTHFECTGDAVAPALRAGWMRRTQSGSAAGCIKGFALPPTK